MSRVSGVRRVRLGYKMRFCCFALQRQRSIGLRCYWDEFKCCYLCVCDGASVYVCMCMSMCLWFALCFIPKTSRRQREQSDTLTLGSDYIIKLTARHLLVSRHAQISRPLARYERQKLFNSREHCDLCVTLSNHLTVCVCVCMCECVCVEQYKRREKSILQPALWWVLSLCAIAARVRIATANMHKVSIWD